jgi:hypothetical protein
VKKAWYMILVVLALATTATCSVTPSDSGTLPNGTTLTAAEVEGLKALSPEAEAIMAENGAQPMNEQTIEKLKELLRANFGDRAERYYGEDVQTRSWTGSAIAAAVGPIGSIYRNFNIYYNASCHKNWGPWWVFNWADCTLRYSDPTKGTPITATRASATITDELGTVTNSGPPFTSNSVRSSLAQTVAWDGGTDIMVKGYEKNGFFPGLTSGRTVTTTFTWWSSNLYGGSWTGTFYWRQS